MSNPEAQAIELKGKELAFALAWIELGPCTGRNKQAAVKAGYAPASASVTGSKLLKKPKIAAYVRAREAAIVKHIEDKQLVTREWIISQLKKVYAQSMVGEPEMVWEDGKLVHSGLWTFNDRGANRALELLGKTIGMFSDKKDDKAADLFNLTINLGDAPKEQKTIEHQPAPPCIDVPIINLDAPL